MKIIRNLARILVGLLFIFSGFVKGVDPMGFAFRIEDYFIAYGTTWAAPLAVFLSVLMCTLEFTIGVLLLLNVKTKQVSWLALVVMVFFTILTFFDAINNPVPDCGCFGDAVKLTNWQTFYKNIVLDVLVVLVFTGRFRFRPAIRGGAAWFTLVIVPLLFASFSMYNFRHLPVVDFLPWKVGVRLFPEKPLPVKYYLKYRNKMTGEEKEFLSKDLPWQDTAWMARWEFKEQRVEDPNKVEGISLKIVDTTGVDMTDNFLRNPGYQFLLAAWDLKPDQAELFSRMNVFAEEAGKEDISFVALVSALPEDIGKFRTLNHISFDIYQADDIELKMMVRSNPGLVLLRNGVVLAKWAYRDFPDYQEFKKKFEGR